MRDKPSQNNHRLTLRANAATVMVDHRNRQTVPLSLKGGIDSTDMERTMAIDCFSAVTHPLIFDFSVFDPGFVPACQNFDTRPLHTDCRNARNLHADRTQ